MTPTEIQASGAELFEAMRERQVVDPLTTRYAGMTIEDAYRVAMEFLNARLKGGERVIGKKIGVTSKPVQRMLDVYRPDFGYITDAMIVPAGEAVAISRLLIQPRAEAEIAFVMRSDLMGPGITTAQVLAAVDFALPCFEIVDSRIRDWKIRIETVADNAYCAASYWAPRRWIRDPSTWRLWDAWSKRTARSSAPALAPRLSDRRSTRWRGLRTRSARSARRCGRERSYYPAPWCPWNRSNPAM